MASLTPVIDKLDDVAEPLRQFYEAKDGKFHVSLSGAPVGFVPAADLAAANGKVIEFRDNNVLLKKTVDELTPLKVAFEGVDPVKAKEALAAQAELASKGIKKPDDLTAMRAAIVEDIKTTMLKPVQDALASITKTNEENQKRADNMTLRSFIGDKFTKAGGLPDLLDYVITQKAAGLFVVDGGVVKAAPNQFSVDKPGEPLTVDEWLTRLTKEASYAFKPSGGGGADPSKGGGGGNQVRAGVTIVKDPTPNQMGEYAADVKAGKVRFEFSADAAH